MAKKEKTKHAEKAETKKRGIRIGLGFKFSFFVALLLTAIMALITVFIYNQEQQALTKEVQERGVATAKNLANNAAEPLINHDDLTLAFLVKEIVQSPIKEEMESENFINNFIATLKNEFIQKQDQTAVKNEGVMEAVIVNKKDSTIAAANDISRNGKPYQLPHGIDAIRPDQDILIQSYNNGAKKYFDITVPITTVMNSQKFFVGEVHLTISQSIITKVITEAAVKISLIILASLVFGIIASIILVSIMVRPVKSLVKGVRDIGEGKYDVQIKVKTRDELGELTDAFNKTALSLKEKELLKGAFSRYVSSSIMEEILSDPTKLSLHGKKVKATILFTDIRNFTSMSESMPPEQVVDILNDYLSLQTDKVFKWNGVLDKFVGDCVMAVFGVPFPKDDDAYRAVMTAIDIRDSVVKMNDIRRKKGQVVVGIGMGINTGDVVSGNMGSHQKMDYTVIGDNVNVASRLEANAPAGAIWVSESTYNETKDLFDFKKLEPIRVKGKKDTVNVYEPIAIKPGPNQANAT